MVNRSISISFDPSKLVCVSFRSEYKLTESHLVTIFFSDQNFVSTVKSDIKQCLCVIHMEDASLSDLSEMSKEIFEFTKIPEGSVFLFGSASYLSCVGTSQYARDWLSVVSKTESF
jgi:hypothetical protein